MAESYFCLVPNSLPTLLENLFDWHLQWVVRPADKITCVWGALGFVVSSRCDFQGAQPPVFDTLCQPLLLCSYYRKKKDIPIHRRCTCTQNNTYIVSSIATGNIVWWSAGLTELLMSELKWKPLDDAVTRGAPPPPPRAEQAASGHWARLSHNWIGTGTGPNFANNPVASEKHYLTSKSQPCPTHLISQHLTKSACDSEALKANTANMSGLLGGNDLHELGIFTEDWLIWVCAKHVKRRNTWIKQ